MSYGENLIVAGWNALTICCLWHWNRKVRIPEKIGVGLGLAGYSYLMLKPGVLPEGYMSYFSLLSVGLGLFSKIP